MSALPMRIPRTTTVVVIVVITLSARSTYVGAQPLTEADSTSELHVQALIDAVLSDNALLRAHRLKAEALNTRGDQVGSLDDPSVTLGYQPYPIYTAKGFQRTQWQIRQDLPFPGKLKLKELVANDEAKEAALGADAYALDMTFDVKHAFYELYRIQEQLEQIRSFHDKLSDFLASVTVRYDVGEGSQQDLLKAQLERNVLDRSLLDLERQKRSVQATISYLTGRPESLSILNRPIRLGSADTLATEVDALAGALRQRPEVQALGTAIQRADRQISLAKKAFLPDFAVGVSYFDIGGSDLTPTMTGSDAVGLQFTVRIPLWRSKLRSNLEEARLHRRETEARYEDLKTAIVTRIGDLIDRISTEQETLILYEQTLIPQAESALRASLSAYTTGQTNFLNLLDAERMLFDLRMGFEDSLAHYMTLIAALERTVGSAPVGPQGGAR